MTTTETPVRYPFLDPIRNVECTLLVDPALRLYDALKVMHDGCAELANVSADLDAFYCTACKWNGRISGAWAVDMWEQGQERRYGCCEEHFPSAAMTPTEQAEHRCPACGWTPSEDDLVTSVRCVCGGPIVEIAEGSFCHVASGGDDVPIDHVAMLDEPESGDDDD